MNTDTVLTVIDEAFYYAVLGIAYTVFARAGFVNIALGGISALTAVMFCAVGHWTGSILLALLGALLCSYSIILMLSSTKLFFGANDVLVSLFANYLLIAIVQLVLTKGFPSTGNAVASPYVPESFIALGDGLSPKIAITIFLIGVGYMLFKHTPLGHQALVASVHISALPMDKRKRVVTLFSAIVAVLVVAFVAIYICSGPRRYSHGLFDLKGFAALTVGMASLNRPWWVPVWAVFLAAFEEFARTAKSSGMPEQGVSVVYGFVLIGAALWNTRKGGSVWSH